MRGYIGGILAPYACFWWLFARAKSHPGRGAGSPTKLIDRNAVSIKARAETQSRQKNMGPRRGPHDLASKTVSRVLYLAVIYLGDPLPDRSSHLLRTAGPAMRPPTVLLRIEFTASDSLQPMGELLPRLSTLTSSTQGQALRRPLTRDEAVYLCCTFPEVAFGGRYFPHDGPFGHATRPPVLLALLFYRRDIALSMK